MDLRRLIFRISNAMTSPILIVQWLELLIKGGFLDQGQRLWLEQISELYYGRNHLGPQGEIRFLSGQS